MSAIEKKFANRLRELRQSKGFTQEELADKADLDSKYIQNLEGKSPPSATLRTLTKLGKAFLMEPWELIKF